MQKWKEILVMKTRINGSRVGEQIIVWIWDLSNETKPREHQKTDSWQRWIWEESEAYLQTDGCLGRSSALLWVMAVTHQLTKPHRRSALQMFALYTSLPRAQARWAEAKLNLLMPHWTSVVAGSSQRAIGLELKVLYMYSSTAPSFGDFFLLCWINFILLNWNRWFTGEHDPARTTVVMNIFSVM